MTDTSMVQIATMMLDDGFSLTDIAKELGVPRSTLYYELHPDKRKHTHQAAGGRVSTCTRCGQPMSYLARRRKPVCKACEREHARRHDETIIMLWRQGLRADEIAEQLGDMKPIDVNHRVTNIRLHQGIDLERRASL